MTFEEQPALAIYIHKITEDIGEQILRSRLREAEKQ